MGRKSATSYTQILGQVIRGQREMRRLGLLEVAKAVGLSSPSGWSRVETGDTTITLAQLRKAARVLKVTPTALVQQADALAARVEASGVTVHDEKPKTDMGPMLLGGAALLALVAAAAAAANNED